ncbi:MAG: hypothetical protein BECKG1743D_GA0114223_112153 [Candidatus Kentron sp. G]|nr:MAG: hypothetical protein BECKG1743E_GA0114224_112303 [Candidatus Kentron sp. G]VFN07969.1 MAG: hypothetical protein BECKG1743D_GA0114223_112153 [Candidatus Kentron sp. G]
MTTTATVRQYAVQDLGRLGGSNIEPDRENQQGNDFLMATFFICRCAYLSVFNSFYRYFQYRSIVLVFTFPSLEFRFVYCS